MIDSTIEHLSTNECEDEAISHHASAHDHAWQLKFDHLAHMMTDIGIWQHAIGNQPDKRHGYSIDDEARGLIIAIEYWKNSVETQFNSRMGSICFRFLRNAALIGSDCGLYHNFCDASGAWLDPTGSADSFGRTVWALGIAYRENVPFAPRELLVPLLEASVKRARSLTYFRSKAFTIVGLAASRMDDVLMLDLCDDLVKTYRQNSAPSWRWFEQSMTYCNARLPHALIESAKSFPDRVEYIDIALESLDFLLQVSKNYMNSYSPIGNAPMATDGWFKRGDTVPPLYDQQPVDAAALVECCSAAYELTGNKKYKNAASDAFNWYLGANVHGLMVYDTSDGSVADAITHCGVSANKGAESVITFHLAVQALRRIID